MAAGTKYMSSEDAGHEIRNRKVVFGNINIKASGGGRALIGAGDTVENKNNKSDTVKPSRPRRTLRRTKQQQQQKQQQGPIGDIGSSELAYYFGRVPSLQEVTSLPALVQRHQHHREDEVDPDSRKSRFLQRATSHRGQSTTSTGGDNPSPQHSITDSFSNNLPAPYGVLSELLVPKGHLNCYKTSTDSNVAVPSGVDGLLARLPPSLDDMMPGKIDASSHSTLPDLIVSRNSSNNGSSRDGEAGAGEHAACTVGSPQKVRRYSNVASSALKIMGKRQSKKSTWSKSEGFHQRTHFSSPERIEGGAPSYGHRDTAVPTINMFTPSTITVTKRFEGMDATLLEEAFAFAERVAKEEEEEEKTFLGGGRVHKLDGKLRRGRIPLYPGSVGAPLRRSKSSGSSVGGGGMCGGGESSGVEDWVRGLPVSSPRRSQSQRHQNHQQRGFSSARSVNNDVHIGSICGIARQIGSNCGGRDSVETGARGGRAEERRKLIVGRRGREAENNLRFDGRREKESAKVASAIAGLVERFESGTGVAALQAELEASQASIRRSSEAIEQVASRWRHHRAMSFAAAMSNKS